MQAGGAVTRFKFPRFREYPFEGIHLQERSQGIEIGRFGAGGALGLFQRRNQVVVQLQDDLSGNEETVCVRSLFRLRYGRNLFFYLLTGKYACQREQGCDKKEAFFHRFISSAKETQLRQWVSRCAKYSVYLSGMFCSSTSLSAFLQPLRFTMRTVFALWSLVPRLPLPILP